MIKINHLLLIVISCSILACEKDDPMIPNESELITTLQYVLAPDDGSSEVILQFKDLDGDGGNPPEITTSPLKAGTVYSATLILLDETQNPAENVTEEILEEGEDHQFFYLTEDLPDVLINYSDMDNNGDPIGIETNLTTGAASMGTLTIILRHLPDKGASMVAEGIIDNAGGETDIQVSFEINVE